MSYPEPPTIGEISRKLDATVSRLDSTISRLDSTYLRREIWEEWRHRSERISARMWALGAGIIASIGANVVAILWHR